MRLSLNIREFRRSQLLRVIAMLFLLHSGVDLLFPQLCSEEESFGGSFNITSPVGDTDQVGEVSALGGSSESPGDQRSDSQHRGEDCFCCCTHVMPSAGFMSPDDAELVNWRSPLARIFIPSAPSDNPYHPPRSV